MSRLTAIDPAQAQGTAKDLLDAVQGKLGITPNMMRTMAQSPAVLEGYLSFSGALAKGTLSAALRAQIALAVAEQNGCNYCLAAHSALGKMAKLDDESILASRQGNAADPKAQAALQFAHTLIATHGAVSEADVAQARAAGFTEGEIGEIIANVALNIFTNYFNTAAQTDIDFPKVQLLAR